MTVKEHIPTKSSTDIFVENFPDLILTINDKSFILGTNKKLQSVLGYNPEDVIGKKLNDFFFEEPSQNFFKSSSVECRFKNKKGTIVPFEIRPFQHDGHTLVLFRELQNTTELRSTLYRNGRVAAMNELAPSLIHDIRNGLSVLGAQHYFMTHNVDKLDTEKFVSGLDIIQKASLKIEKVINQLRDLIHREETLSKVNVHELMEAMIFLVEPQSRQINAKIYNRIPHKLEYECVRQQIEQVFYHLLTNALDAVYASQEKSIYAEASMNQDTLVLNMRDTGCGIDPKNADKIFDPFFTTKTDKKASGLGLYVCKSISSKHGGTIKMASELNKGTVFTLSLPVIKS